jgi:tRNA nucleotidyltransferase/poly(A) polymerase
MIRTEVLNKEKLSNIIYSYGEPYDFDKKIKYFHYFDIRSSHLDYDPNEKYKARTYFVTLFDDDDIIGLAKLQENPYNQQGLFWIQYISIDDKHQGMRYSKYIIDRMIKFCKENKFKLKTSGYSTKGWERLREYLHLSAGANDVELIDTKEKPEYENHTSIDTLVNTKVIDFNKKPLIVYHGTNNKFDIFDINMINTNEKSGDYIGSGIYFTRYKDTALKYAKQAVKKGGGLVNIISAYLNIEHPLIINNTSDAQKLRDLFGGEFNYFSILDDNPNLIKDELIKLGYDGLIDNMYNQYAVFEPSQIKIIDNSVSLQNENIVSFSNFIVNEEHDYTKESILKFIKDRNLYLMDGKYLELYHGTDPASYRKIEKSGKLKSGTWFGIDYETSRRYGLMRLHRGEPVVMKIYVDIDSLYISSEYFIAKHDLKMNLMYGSGSNVYENKNPNIKCYICENNNTKEEMFIPEDILEFHDLFTQAGKKLFLVGGCIRDYIMGKTPHDYDLVTDASPDETKQILKNYRTNLQGAHFGVIRVYTEDEPKGYEVASYRRDISKGRSNKGDDQKVEIGSHITIKDDVLRRDITQNALFYDIGKKEIIDLVGGIEDIKNGIIRAVGNPMERFNEDRLRILRVFRFSARSRFKIDDETANAIKKDNRLNGLSPEEDVSQERILEEIFKIWEYASEKNDLPAWKLYLKYLTEFKMWNQMFKNMLINEDVINIDSLDLIQMYTYLFLDNTPDTEFNKRLIRTFKFSSDNANIICFLLTFYNNINDVDKVFDMKKKQNQFDIDPNIIKEFSDIHKLDKKFTDKFIEYDLTVSGQELMDSGLKGNEIGIEQRKQEKEIFQNMINESFDF